MPVTEHRESTAAPRSLGHQVALDGLRAVAVAAVVLFHLPTRTFVPGGLFGVDIFFALSGFLVAALLLGEHARTGAVRLRAFLARRGWRLLPALVAFLAAYLALATLFGSSGWFSSNPFSNGPGGPVGRTEAAKGTLAVLSYGFNEMRAHAVSFPGLGHLWSLSIEGQFYLLFPIALVLVLRRWPRWMLPITATAAALSAASPWLVGTAGHGHTIIYYSSFTRMQGLLIGAVGAQLWHLGLVGRVPILLRRLLAAASAVTLAVLVLHVGNTQFKYEGALTLAPVAATIVVLHLVEPGGQGTINWVLSRRPVVWLGRRSYAVYLWHYALACWTNLLPHDVGVPLTIIGALGLAELSWRLVEAPAQQWARQRRRRRAAEPAATAPVPPRPAPVPELAAAAPATAPG
jgi:peptidoglycan/LPS O-acetylase OafA/YrhL